MRIIQDTREKYPWNFGFHKVEVIRQKLDTGDYSIEGYENQICIERKRTTGEIAVNLGKKAKQFEAELKRMADFRFAFIICEFNLEDINIFPHNSGIPKNQWPFLRISPQFLNSRLNRWSETYGVEIVYCGNTVNAENIAISLLRESYNVIRSEETN